MALQRVLPLFLLQLLSLLQQLASVQAKERRASYNSPPRRRERRRRSGRGLAVADWDSDGDLDVIVGGLWGGISYFENIAIQYGDTGGGCQDVNNSMSEAQTGSAGVPQQPKDPSATPVVVSAAGVCTQLVWRQGESNPFFASEDYLSWKINPEVVDWDGDGDLDLLYTRGMAHGLNYFERSGVNSSGASTGFCYKFGFGYWPIDFAGHGGTEEETLRACQGRCEDISGCAHFTYWSKGNYLSTNCHLQDAQAVLREGNSITTGPPVCPTGSLIEDTRMYYGRGPHNAGGIKAIDYDGDNDLDLFIGTSFHTVRYWEQIGSTPPAGDRVPIFCFEAARWYGNMGGESSYYVEGGANACQDKCYSRDGCTHFSFIHHGVWSNCHLHSSSSVTDKDFSFYDSVGPRECPSGSLVERLGTDHPLKSVREWFFISPEVVDVDGDGDLDGVIADNDGNVVLYSNDGGTFNRHELPGPLGHVKVWPGPGAIRMLDFNGDGNLDILMVGWYDYILFWNGAYGDPSQHHFTLVGAAPGCARALWTLPLIVGALSCAWQPWP